MSIWYRTTGHETSTTGKWGGPTIEEVEVQKSTDSSVWIGTQQRRNKRSSYENFFETRDEAVKFIREAQQMRIDYHKRMIENHEVNLKAVV